jgi:hypothetical protein
MKPASGWWRARGTTDLLPDSEPCSRPESDRDHMPRRSPHKNKGMAFRQERASPWVSFGDRRNLIPLRTLRIRWSRDQRQQSPGLCAVPG